MQVIFAGSLLYVAVVKGNLEVVRLLLEKYANPSIQDKGGVALLHVAVVKGHLEVVKELLARNADPNIPNKGGGGGRHYTLQ